MNNMTREEILALANRIKQLREQHGMSQKDLANKLGVSRVAVTKYEKGESTPSRRLKQFADVFHVSTDYLLGNHDCLETTSEKQKAVGERISILRKKNKLDKASLAKICNVTTRAVTAWEDGITSPSLETISKLAEVFDTTTDYILGRVTTEKEIPKESTLMESILEQLYSDNPDMLEKVKDCKVYGNNIELNDTEKEFLKSSLNVIFKAKGITE